MKIVTWNINSLRVRLPQILSWLTLHSPDVVCFQELKLSHEQFPVDTFSRIGYNCAWYGQKTYNGVATLSLRPTGQETYNIPQYQDPQRRVVATTLRSTIGNIRIINIYAPNGGLLDSEKYKYKLKWYSALYHWINIELRKYPLLVILGDYNIAPTDEDVYDSEEWKERTLVSEAERAAFEALITLGMLDVFRLFKQKPKSFSWWDYRTYSFKRNAGLRIDHVLVSRKLSEHCISCTIDKKPRSEVRPSDHAPVIMVLNAE